MVGVVKKFLDHIKILYLSKFNIKKLEKKKNRILLESNTKTLFIFFKNPIRYKLNSIHCEPQI